MSSIKVSALTAKTSPSGSEELLINDAGTSKKITIANLPATADSTKLPLAGGTMTGTTAHGDNVKATFGAGADLQIYHDGSDSWLVDNGDGGLKLGVSGTGTSGFYKGTGGETIATFEPDGPVDLYHNNAKKLATTSTGIDVTGSVTCDGATIAGTINTTAAQINMSNGYGLRWGDTSIYGSDASGSEYLRFDINSSEKLRIDSSGNVGVGTSSPSSYNSNGQSLVVAGTGNTGITVSSGTASKSSIMFADGTGGTAAYRGSLKYDHSSDDMILSTATAEAMRIDSTGRVGIGTSSPDDVLTIDVKEGSNNVRAIHLVGGPDVTNKYISIGRTHSVTNDYINSEIRFGAELGGNGAAYMAFAVNGNPTAEERMRIDSSGVVEFKNGITESQVTNSGATYTIDLNAGTIFNLTSASTCTVTMPSVTAGKSFTVIAAVPSAWSGTIKWSGGSAPTGTGICIYTFVSNGTDWYGMEAGNAFA